MAQTAAEREACQADFEKYCPGVHPGGGRIIECLAEHLNELTPECQKIVKAHMPN
ncbi:cysteine rich repeat-containing protein [Mesorhizobium sp. 1B3]|uniref:cysteine rich repeat-containing protein n=1 Tax=Mesorhizobium sp. 1B3 TaxID=3243599 RepID=UPI003D97668C